MVDFFMSWKSVCACIGGESKGVMGDVRCMD
jgi:hypothetical protein